MMWWVLLMTTRRSNIDSCNEAKGEKDSDGFMQRREESEQEQQPEGIRRTYMKPRGCGTWDTFRNRTVR